MKKSTLLYGIHAVSARLKQHPKTVSQLLLDDRRDDHKLNKIKSLGEEAGIEIQWVARDQLDRLSKGENHQGVLAYIHAQKTVKHHSLTALLDAMGDSGALLLLDGVQDPHNLGACLRTADAAGVEAIVIPKDKAVSVNQTVAKVACGAAETVPVFEVTNMVRTIEQLQAKGFWVVGLTEEATDSLYQLDWPEQVAIVMGAEGGGMRRLTKSKCDYLVHIPMAGEVSSLNVSVATGVCLFEWVRQRDVVE